MHQTSVHQERSVMSRTAPSPARSSKIKALLAGGLVLGVGAAVTLASWTDQAYVDATFGTSSFNIQVDTAEGAETWIEAEMPDDARTLAFSVGFDALEPGDTVYAPVSLRTDPDGSVGGTVTLGSATPGAEADQDLFDALTYTVTSLTEGATCDADATGDTLVDGPLDTGAVPDAIALGANGEDPADLCFAVTLPQSADENTALQGVETSALWHFEATSADDA